MMIIFDIITFLFAAFISGLPVSVTLYIYTRYLWKAGKVSHKFTSGDILGMCMIAWWASLACFGKLVGLHVSDTVWYGWFSGPFLAYGIAVYQDYARWIDAQPSSTSDTEAGRPGTLPATSSWSRNPDGGSGLHHDAGIFESGTYHSGSETGKRGF